MKLIRPDATAQITDILNSTSNRKKPIGKLITDEDVATSNHSGYHDLGTEEINDIKKF